MTMDHRGMLDLLQLIASCTVGALLGAAFFWGLWVTVRRLSKASNPAAWILGSLLLRFGLVLAGFYLLALYGDWQQVLAAAVGFTLSRLFMARCLWPRHADKESGA